MATRDLGMAYTDIRPEAAWRETVYTEDPWTTPSVIMTLQGFDLSMVMIDLLHAWYLGMARDLCASVLKVLVSSKLVFVGSKIETRLEDASQRLRQYATAHGKQLSLKHLTRANLNWKSSEYPELRAKGADCAVILEWLSDVVTTNVLPAQHSVMVAAVWAGNTWTKILSKAQYFMSEHELDAAAMLGDVCLNSYFSLACWHAQRKLLLFKVRPKAHLMCHVHSLRWFSRRNPGAHATWCDEDLVKHMIRIKRKVHARTATERTLQRYLESLNLKLASLAMFQDSLAEE